MPDPHFIGAFAVLAATAACRWFYGRDTVPVKPPVPLKDRQPIYYDPKKDGEIKLPN